jgi:hypothetical protein
MDKPHPEPEVEAAQRLGHDPAQLVEPRWTMCMKRCAMVRPYRVTIILRHETDPEAHAMLGQGGLDELAQFIREMAACEGRRSTVIRAGQGGTNAGE